MGHQDWSHPYSGPANRCNPEGPSKGPAPAEEDACRPPCCSFQVTAVCDFTCHLNLWDLHTYHISGLPGLSGGAHVGRDIAVLDSHL